MNIENAVADHYGIPDLLGQIFTGLERVGADLYKLTTEDLAPVDEFHIGGRKATAHAIAKLSPATDDHVLDIGCGWGGFARHAAGRYGVHVVGISPSGEQVGEARGRSGNWP